MSGIGLVATAHYLPERWMTANEVAAASGIPEEVVVTKFGLRGKHVAAEDEHVSDLAVAAGKRLLDEHGVDPSSIGTVLYYGSTWKDYPVWQETRNVPISSRARARRAGCPAARPAAPPPRRCAVCPRACADPARISPRCC